VNTVAVRYKAMCRQIVAEARAGNGAGSVPLLRVAMIAMPELFLPSDAEPATVAGVVAEFQERWRRILDLPPAVQRHHLTSERIAGKVAREFATGPGLWSGARIHSPDIMIAAASPKAVGRGECQLVLGKL